jgi:hypothetical protein
MSKLRVWIGVRLVGGADQAGRDRLTVGGNDVGRYFGVSAYLSLSAIATRCTTTPGASHDERHEDDAWVVSLHAEGRPRYRRGRPRADHGRPHRRRRDGVDTDSE